MPGDLSKSGTSETTTTDDDSPELPPVVGSCGLRCPWVSIPPVAQPSLASSLLSRMSSRLFAAHHQHHHHHHHHHQRSARTSCSGSRREERDSLKLSRGADRRHDLFPARGRLFPGVALDELPNAPEGCRWLLSGQHDSVFGMDWLKDALKNDVTAALQGTPRIARAVYRGDLIPGWSLGRGECQITWGGQAVTVVGSKRVQILDGSPGCSLSWSAWKGSLPPGAISIGRTYDGEPLYLGRRSFHDRTFFGRLQVSYGSLLVSLAGAESVFSDNFDVLLAKASSAKTAEIPAKVAAKSP